MSELLNSLLEWFIPLLRFFSIVTIIVAFDMLYKYKAATKLGMKMQLFKNITFSLFWLNLIVIIACLLDQNLFGDLVVTWYPTDMKVTKFSVLMIFIVKLLMFNKNFEVVHGKSLFSWISTAISAIKSVKKEVSSFNDESNDESKK